MLGSCAWVCSLICVAAEICASLNVCYSGSGCVIARKEAALELCNLALQKFQNAEDSFDASNDASLDPCKDKASTR